MLRHNIARSIIPTQPASLGELSYLFNHLHCAIDDLYEVICEHVETEGDDPDLGSLRLVVRGPDPSYGILTYDLSMETR